MEVRNNTPVFAARDPPRVENTEARPSLKRWAYFLTDKSKRDMDKQKVIVYVDGFNFGSVDFSVGQLHASVGQLYEITSPL